MRGLALLVATLLLGGCGGTGRDTERPTSPPTPATPPGGLAPYVTKDPAHFPKMASHLAFDFGDGSTNAHFALNIVRGCNPSVADRSFRLNPKQVNLIVPGTSISSASPSECGAEDGFAVTYGSGYWNDSSAIVSPYPGIGTIRPFRTDDIARYKDDSRAFSDDSPVLNMFSSGNDDATAEWAARLKAHWTLADLGGAQRKHPGVQGVWGDNFLWFNGLSGQKSAGGSSFGDLDGRAWDDGLVRNSQQLRALLGPDMLLGGNGAPWACSGEVDYAGDIPDGECTAADVGMWEDTSSDIYSASGWDARIPQFDKWIKARLTTGRARYGVMVEYGTRGTGNLGHPLTTTDERLGLAMATIGGIHLWAVHDGNWSTTVVPGGQFSIPEMGDNPAYPRGWLGQPTSEPVRVSLGRWKRTFSGGSVYANVADTTWRTDRVSVPPRNALFVKGFVKG
jgi:hypothetical protein